MRWRKADLRRRVNGNLELRFGRDGLTSYAGLELVRRYFVSLGLVALLRRELASVLPHSDFGVSRMVLVVLALIISGGRRLRHLLFVAEDPVVLRLCGLNRMPTPRTVGRWLAEFRQLSEKRRPEFAERRMEDVMDRSRGGSDRLIAVRA